MPLRRSSQNKIMLKGNQMRPQSYNNGGVNENLGARTELSNSFCFRLCPFTGLIPIKVYPAARSKMGLFQRPFFSKQSGI
jgi:hypothetical protein